MSDPIICPHCGRVFDQAEPRVARLSPAAYRVYSALRARMPNGRALGVSRLAEYAQMSHTGLYRHLRQMIAAGLVEREKKRAGGVYHVYRLK